MSEGKFSCVAVLELSEIAVILRDVPTHVKQKIVARGLKLTHITTDLKFFSTEDGGQGRNAVTATSQASETNAGATPEVSEVSRNTIASPAPVLEQFCVKGK